MGPFINDVSLYSVSYNKMSDWKVSEKDHIYNLMAEGIQTGVVRPHVPLSTSSSLPKVFCMEKASDFSVNSKESYLIAGDDEDYVVDVVEWIVRMGGRNIVMHITDCNAPPRRLKTLRMRKDINLVFTDGVMYNTFMNDVQRSKLQFDSIFYVSSNASPSATHEIQQILDSPGRGHLIFITNDINGVIEKEGRQITNIVWRAEFGLLGCHLDHVVKHIGKERLITVSNNYSEVIIQPRARNLLRKILPATVEGYSKVTPVVQSAPTFYQLPFEGNISGATPIFIFPGFELTQNDILTNLGRGSLLPIYIANLGDVGDFSMEDLAGFFTLSMKLISKGRVMNIVGLSAGCGLAIEAARILESEGHCVPLLLVDNPISALQNGFSSKQALLETFFNQMATTFTSELHIKDVQPLSFTSQVDCLFDTLGTSKMVGMCRKSALFIHDCLNKLLTYKMEDAILKGPVSVFHSKDVYDLYDYLKLSNNAKSYYIHESHEALLKSKYIKEVIQEYALTECYMQQPRTVNANSWYDFNRYISGNACTIDLSVVKPCV